MGYRVFKVCRNIFWVLKECFAATCHLYYPPAHLGCLCTVGWANKREQSPSDLCTLFSDGNMVLVLCMGSNYRGKQATYTMPRKPEGHWYSRFRESSFTVLTSNIWYYWYHIKNSVNGYGKGGMDKCQDPFTVLKRFWKVRVNDRIPPLYKSCSSHSCSARNVVLAILSS